jgi:hypothetical protein
MGVLIPVRDLPANFIFSMSNTFGKREKQIAEWRSKKLGYVYFSHLQDLIIDEPNLNEALFDYLIDIGENNQQTGRLFGVEVKALNANKPVTNKLLRLQYRNVTFPALLVMFDNKNDRGYFTWIKKPEKNGLLIAHTVKDNMHELNNSALQQIVQKIKNWYKQKGTA